MMPYNGFSPRERRASNMLPLRPPKRPNESRIFTLGLDEIPGKPSPAPKQKWDR